MSEQVNPFSAGLSNVTTHEHESHEEHVVTAKTGMWLFLLSEMLLFGILFLLYMSYRLEYGKDFIAASKEENLLLGTFNTIILITSSLTMALSIVAMINKRKWLSVFFISTTIGLAIFFLINKYFEWMEKIHAGIYPGSSELADRGNGQTMFYGLYYFMTGLHGLHVIIGIVILAFMLVFIIRDKITPDDYVKLENSGLYWHLVDLIWIFLFPLFYLIH